MKRVRIAYPYIFVWMPIFIIAPMLFVAYYAFFQDGHFTLEFVKLVFSTTSYLPAFWNSLWIAVVTTVVCLLIGYPVAYILSNMKKSTATLLSMLFILPMWMNMLLRTLAWRILLDEGGIISKFLSLFGAQDVSLINNAGAVLVATIYDFLPFMILPIYTTLIKIDKSHIEAAHDLGANGFQTFTKVILPQSVPGIISGITMVLVPAMSTFAISTILGGGKVRLLGQVIEEKYKSASSYGYGVGSVMSLVLIILVIISMVIMRKADKENDTEGGTLW